MKKLATFLLIISSFCINAQVTSADFDPDFAAKLQFRLDSIVTANGVQGASCAAYIPGQGTWVGVSGESYPGTPITPDMRFCIASQTKGMVAAVILKLQEMGLLSINDHLYDWLPSYEYIDSNITIEQLLTMHSGLYDYINDNPDAWDSVSADFSRVWTEDDILTQLMGPPLYAANETYDYCNTNYLLLGMIIQVITGGTLGQALHEYIWDPAGMDSTFMPADEPYIGTLAHNWEYGTDYTAFETTAINTILKAAGGTYSTASEMVTWYKKLFEGEIISPESVNMMTDYEHLFFYGFGMAQNYVEYSDALYGDIMHQHDGSWIGYNSQTMYDSENQTIVSVELNGRPDNPYVIMFDLFQAIHTYRPLKSDDAGIGKIISPYGNNCENLITPEVELNNYGDNTLTEVEIHFGVDGGADNMMHWTGELLAGENEIVSLPVISFTDGFYQFYAFTSSPNGNDDNYFMNDEDDELFGVSEFMVETIPYHEDFETAHITEKGWIVKPNDKVLAWGTTHLSAYEGINSLVKNNFADNHYNAVYDILSPVIDLSSIEHAQLSLAYAYKTYTGYADSLNILVSVDCGETFESVFYAGGADISMGNTTKAFDAKPSDFEILTFDLSAYAGNEITIKLRDICGYSNNLFIDEFKIEESPVTIEENLISTINIFPNPFTDQATIQLSGLIENATLDIYNSLNQKVASYSSISGTSVELKRNAMPAGNYYFRMTDQNGIAGTGKFMII